MSAGSGKLLDALHAELLGDVADLTTSVRELKESLPRVTASTKQDCEAMIAQTEASFKVFKDSSIALVAYIKSKQIETLGEIDSAHTKVTTATQKTLSGFERVQWLMGGLCAINTLLLLAIVIFRK